MFEISSIAMSESRRFLRELFMYRYSQLLLALDKHYLLTPDQKTKLYKTILNLEWIDQAFEESNSEN